MKKRILFYLDGWFYHFGIANKLQEDYEIFGIVDMPVKSHTFFKNQKIVNFEKLFFYDNHESFPEQDRNFLSSFETKYDINLSKIIFSDRNLQQYNFYHKFTEKEIIGLLSKECQFFDSVLNEINPDLFFSYMPIHHPHYLLEQMCKGKNIECLILSPIKLGDRLTVSHQALQFDKPAFELSSSKEKEIHQSSNENFIEKFDPYKQIKNFQKIAFQQNRFLRYKSLIDFLFEDLDSTRYDDKGKTKFKVLNSKLKRSSNRKKVQQFFDKNLSKEIPKTPFAYFPLHYEPEKVLLIDAPYFAEQISVIENIAKSLPIDYQLCVKDHPMMETRGWREQDFYQKIMNLPNVLLLHPQINPKDIMKQSKIVISISGTTCLEAAFLDTPSICFTDQIFSALPCVTTIDNLKQIPIVFPQTLNRHVNSSDIKKFVQIVIENSFEFDHIKFSQEFAYEFGFKGPSMNKSLDENKIKKFLEKHDDDYTLFTREYLKKIT